MREIKAPSRPGLERRIFLAGSIEMGQAEQWQQQIVDALSGAGDLVILNPRRATGMTAGRSEPMTRSFPSR
jgi:hypothetical protein